MHIKWLYTLLLSSLNSALSSSLYFRGRFGLIVFILGGLLGGLFGCGDDNRGPSIVPLSEQNWQVNQAQLLEVSADSTSVSFAVDLQTSCFPDLSRCLPCTSHIILC